jgi:hypothetical protein
MNPHFEDMLDGEVLFLGNRPNPHDVFIYEDMLKIIVTVHNLRAEVRTV